MGLPNEIICHVLSYITDIRDIVNCSAVSHLFRKCTRSSSTIIQSNDKVQISIKNIENFNRLKVVHENITIFAKAHNILQTIPNIQKANFNLGNLNDDLRFLKKCYELLSCIQNLNKANIKILAQVNNKLIMLVVQSNKAMLIGNDSEILTDSYTYTPMHYFAQKFRSLDLLNYYPHGMVRTPYGNFQQFLISKATLEFLRGAIFGQSHPDNLQISEIIKPLLSHGLILGTRLKVLFRIYIAYNKLNSKFCEFIPTNITNEKLDIIVQDSLLILLTPNNFNEYTIPETKIDWEILSKIDKSLLNTLRYYRTFPELHDLAI